MSKKVDILAMLALQKGCKLICIEDCGSSKGLKYGSTYIFDEYDESLVPKNKQNAIMTWYPDKPLWTPERYEIIRYEFMRIKLVGIEEPMMLKFFDII